MHEEKTVSYTSQNTYYTLNKLTEKTTKIWLVCHGIGYLSPYFLEHFKKLDPERNYIIAPQAPSKYYQDKRYKYIGASWFTRLNTEMETHKQINNDGDKQHVDFAKWFSPLKVLKINWTLKTEPGSQDKNNVKINQSRLGRLCTHKTHHCQQYHFLMV